MSFAIKLRGEFRGYYAGLYRLDGQRFVGCVDAIDDKKVKKYKSEEAAKKHIEEIEKSASFEIRYGCKNIICEIVEVTNG